MHEAALAVIALSVGVLAVGAQWTLLKDVRQLDVYRAGPTILRVGLVVLLLGLLLLLLAAALA